MRSQDINIETVTIDIFVDDQKDANAFLNQSVEEIKQYVLPEIEKQLIELNVISDSAQSDSVSDIDFGTLELDLVTDKPTWKEVLTEAISTKITQAITSDSLLEKDAEKDIETKSVWNDDQRKRMSTHLSDSDASRSMAGDVAASEYLMKRFMIFLKTGVLPTAKGILDTPASYAQLETEIFALESSKIWSHLSPVFYRNEKAATRFLRQSSPAFWNKVVDAQFSNEVQQFIESWIALELGSEERIKTVILRFLVKEFAATITTLGFSEWKEKFVSFLVENHSKTEVLDLFGVDAKTDPKTVLKSGSKTRDRIKNKNEKEPSDKFQKQWTELKSEWVKKIGITSIDEDQKSAEAKREIKKKDHLESSDLSGEKSVREKETEPTKVVLPDPLIIENAGIVLLQPFFPSVFKNLEFLTEKNQWVDDEARVKAIYTLHYLATGEFEASEDLLLIEKLLTGFPLDEVIPLVEEEDIVTDALKEQMTELLDVVHDNWKPMRNCTWVGLRNDFLTRSAELEQIDELQYKLIIEPHFLDVLLPSKNWGISMVKYSWMDGFVFVEWGE